MPQAEQKRSSLNGELIFPSQWDDNLNFPTRDPFEPHPDVTLHTFTPPAWYPQGTRPEGECSDIFGDECGSIYECGLKNGDVKDDIHECQLAIWFIALMFVVGILVLVGVCICCIFGCVVFAVRGRL